MRPHMYAFSFGGKQEIFAMTPLFTEPIQSGNKYEHKSAPK